MTTSESQVMCCILRLQSISMWRARNPSECYVCSLNHVRGSD
jgi:hypothetical protein